MIWTKNICRLCGIVNSDQNSVFKLFGNETIEYKIKKCLNFSIFKDDCKPKEICNSCLVKVQQFSDFVDICNEANQKFDSLITDRNSCSEVRNLNIPEYIQQKSVIVNLKNGMGNCPNQSVVLPSENINVPLQDEVLQIVSGNSNMYTANLQENLNDYMRTTSRYIPFYEECNNTVLRHSSDIESLPIQNELYPNPVLSYGCEHKFSEPIGVDENCTNHLRTQRQAVLEKKLDDNIDVDNCVEEVLNTKSADNLISIESIQNKLNLTKEIITPQLKSRKKFKCPHCDRDFIRRISLNSHIAIHTKNRPFKCLKCGKAFPIKSELTIHKKIHSDQYQCKICFKTFIVPSKLERHLRTHNNEKPFKCSYVNCGKTFSDQSNLFEHLNIHKDSRDLKCKSCDKCFKTKSQLKSHKLSHKSDVPFTCDICKKSYKYKTNLIFHMKKHTGYICPFCDLDCEKVTALVKHRRDCNKSKVN